MDQTPMKFPAAGLKPLLLLVGLAAAVAAGVGIALWSQAPTYSLLFGNLSDSDMAQITQALNQANVRYKLDGSAVLVPADKVNQVRLDMIGKGLGAGSDLSLLDKDPGFGVSQFMENVRYQQALQNELARTISSIGAVAGARVHLAVPQQSAFVRDRRQVSASVFLKLRNGSRLSRENINAIVSLVAAAIPELDPANVALTDNNGRLLSSPEKDGDVAAREQQLEMARRLEGEYSERIISMLTPLLGPDRVRAQVAAELDTASTEEAREQYRPDSQVVRSEQSTEDISRSAAGPQGVPGALTNQPPQGGTALPPGVKPDANAQVAAAGDPASSSKQSTRNYEIDRTVAYTRTPAGRLMRLSVAVVIDDLRITDAQGKVTQTPLTPEQIASITTLVRSAVGFDEKRGDTVSVINQSFLPENTVAAEIESTPIWQHPLVRDIAKILAGLVIVALLLLFVVKPLIRSITTVATQPAFAGGGGAQLQGEMPMAAPAPSRPGNAIAYEQQIAQARSLVAKDPARVAQVVKDWVQKDD